MTTAIDVRFRVESTDSGTSLEGVDYFAVDDILSIRLANGTAIRLFPGRQISADIASAIAGASDEHRSRRARITMCPDCGTYILQGWTPYIGKTVALSTEESPYGAWYVDRDGIIQMLEPMQEYVGATYREHRCQQITSEPCPPDAEN